MLLLVVAPYSPDIAPENFFLFPKLKLPLRGTRFQSVEDLKENSGRELDSIPETAFKKRFDDWIICWCKCFVSEGAYFEGDKINMDE
jgi:[histone H3]-lysine36 N-dimethyltransferase SETMAR